MIGIFQENFDKDNLFSGRPFYWYKGTKVSVYVTSTEIDGIDGDILANIFCKVEKLIIHEEGSKNSLITFCLLDGQH